MKIFLIVHGFVQGVGYRHHVKRAAQKYGIVGMVRNMEDGSVHVLAEGSEESIGRFEKEINVSMGNGPSVHHVERYTEHDREFPKGLKDYREFVVER
ncbi:MAG: acylphosphatase [Candidatus Micrarchaeota archaeon]|nr:acylphosphatase [Candidatus Micrarchaeota archaeon]MDE1823778.1 acylphosphatase [Candidatus Micrarchaeota archaeon]MDE1849575.1 acylphosphatase [Candidatus Micrarchaeota archaeon]